jgi:hypothetical protein
LLLKFSIPPPTFTVLIQIRNFGENPARYFAVLKDDTALQDTHCCSTRNQARKNLQDLLCLVHQDRYSQALHNEFGRPNDEL